MCSSDLMWCIHVMQVLCFFLLSFACSDTRLMASLGNRLQSRAYRTVWAGIVLTTSPACQGRCMCSQYPSMWALETGLAELTACQCCYLYISVDISVCRVTLLCPLSSLNFHSIAPLDP